MSGAYVYALFLLYLAILCTLKGPYGVGLTWYSDGRAPRVGPYIYPYVLIGTAFFIMLAVSAVFGDTYSKRATDWLSSVRAPITQILWKRLFVVFGAVSLPLCAYLSFAFFKMEAYYDKYVKSSLHDQELSKTYSYAIPEVSDYFFNIFVQMIVFTAACILINHALLAVSGQRGVQVLVFISYCAAEYFGFSLMIPSYGLITAAVRSNYNILTPVPTYTLFQIIVMIIALAVSLTLTKRKLAR